jgi:hypothetical protein
MEFERQAGLAYVGVIQTGCRPNEGDLMPVFGSGGIVTVTDAGGDPRKKSELHQVCGAAIKSG